MNYVSKKEDQRQQSFEFVKNMSQFGEILKDVFEIKDLKEKPVDYEQMAKTAHEASHAIVKFLDEESKAWEDLSAESKNQAIEAASYIYHDDDITPQKIHEMFLEKFKDVNEIKEKYPTGLPVVF